MNYFYNPQLKLWATWIIPVDARYVSCTTYNSNCSVGTVRELLLQSGFVKVVM